ncbi:hypothetical protein DMUE_4858 [Dictyocoela muelleri]|nr:hypothetical protein DMUE_4858 [Dictyocoela muelleri]
MDLGSYTLTEEGDYSINILERDNSILDYAFDFIPSEKRGNIDLYKSIIKRIIPTIPYKIDTKNIRIVALVTYFLTLTTINVNIFEDFEREIYSIQDLEYNENTLGKYNQVYNENTEKNVLENLLNDDNPSISLIRLTIITILETKYEFYMENNKNCFNLYLNILKRLINKDITKQDENKLLNAFYTWFSDVSYDIYDIELIVNLIAASKEGGIFVIMALAYESIINGTKMEFKKMPRQFYNMNLQFIKIIRKYPIPKN